MSDQSYTVAVAQIDSVLGDQQQNVARHREIVQKAREGGADLVVFPELSCPGYSIKDLHWELGLRSTLAPVLQPLIEESDEITMLVGVVEEGKEGGLYNAAFCIESGRIRSVHRKIYPPTYGMFEELRYFSAGTSVRAFDTRVGRLGVLICEDVWHLSLPYLLAMDGASVLIGMAASPTRLAPQEQQFSLAELNSEQHRSIARLLSSYLVFCNRAGYEDGVNFWGGSEIIDPSGNVVVRAKLFEEDLILAEINHNELRRARRLSRHFLDEQPHVVAAELRRIMRERMTGSDDIGDSRR